MASFSTSRPDTVLRLKIKKGKKDDGGTNNKSRGQYLPSTNPDPSTSKSEPNRTRMVSSETTQACADVRGQVKRRLGPVASECTVGLCACTSRAITPTASHQRQGRRLPRVVDRARTAQQRRYNERTARQVLGREHNRWIACFPTSRPSIHRCRSERKADRLSGRLAGSSSDLFIFFKIYVAKLLHFAI